MYKKVEFLCVSSGLTSIVELGKKQMYVFGVKQILHCHHHPTLLNKTTFVTHEPASLLLNKSCQIFGIKKGTKKQVRDFEKKVLFSPYIMSLWLMDIRGPYLILATLYFVVFAAVWSSFQSKAFFYNSRDFEKYSWTHMFSVDCLTTTGLFWVDFRLWIFVQSWFIRRYKNPVLRYLI